ncbi:MAG TPA: hypothetical protein PKE27_02065 [Povalibacter sp.]|uniref:hypothetical protein n=1 Tax=Povalibacter sp. TaxID=1962978 RepID=UPI002CAAF838|nr:hypothetical protein [Povalibacter sp.]HMN43326.1 hypothetical protein [Povalibacter sp.]
MRQSIRTALTFALLLTACSSFAADAPALLVRTRLEPATVAISQPATLYVETYTELFFTSGIELPALNIPGAIVKLSDERPSHVSRNVGNVSWTGIEHQYSITPIVGADLNIPSFDVSAHSGPQSQLLSGKTRALTLKVDVPAGAEGRFVTHDLRIGQSVDRDLTTLKVGDSFTRRITIIATGTPAMFIPETPAPQIDGLSIYPAPPVLEDQTDAAGPVGQRTESITYLVQQPGNFSVPETTIEWWDLDSREPKTATVPALDLHADAAPPPTPVFEIPPEQVAPAPPRTFDWRRASHVLGGSIAALLLLYWLAPRVVRFTRKVIDRFAARRIRYLDSERHAFRELRRIVRRGDVHAIPQALYRWLDRLPASSRPSRDHAAVTQIDTRLARGSEALLDRCYALQRDDASAALNDFDHALRSARRQLLSHGRSASPVTRCLPDLNPA